MEILAEVYALYGAAISSKPDSHVIVEGKIDWHSDTKVVFDGYCRLFFEQFDANLTI